MAFYHDPRLQTNLQYHYLPTTELQQQRKQVCGGLCVGVWDGRVVPMCVDRGGRSRWLIVCL